MCTLDIQNT